jgi:hypothetical protein
LLAKGGELAHPEMPFKLRVKTYFVNSDLRGQPFQGFEPVQADNSTGQQIWWRSLPKTTTMDTRDVPSGIVELIEPAGRSQAILVSGNLAPLQMTAGDKAYQLALRPTRYYKPFRLHLLDFRFDRYAGTDTPKNFSSRVRLERADKGEDREVTIRMNEPLRYAGETFFQADWDKTDEKGTVLQVVDNPGWLTPYFACVLVAAGMIWQFMTHLIGFAAKRKSP